MVTQRTLDKLDDMIDTDLSVADIRFALRNWDDCQRKLVTQVIRAVKGMANVPAALQTLFVDTDARAIKNIADVVVSVQDTILSNRDFTEDRPVLLARAVNYTHIGDALWVALCRAAKAKKLRPVQVKKLAARKDCPDGFLTAAGIEKLKAARSRVAVTDEVRPPRRTPEAAEPVRRGRKAKEEVEIEPAPKTSKTVKNVSAVDKVRAVFKAKKVAAATEYDLDDDEEDDDFTDEKVSSAVRTVRRPRT